MLTISRFTCENLIDGCVTDNQAPKFSFFLESDRENVEMEEAVIEVNGWTRKVKEQIAIPYAGKPLEPFTLYKGTLRVTDNYGEEASKDLYFETGRMETPWKGRWISDASYKFKEKRVSPKPMVFRKCFKSKKKILAAKIYSTAMGIYDLELNGKRVGDTFFSPGFTSYKNWLQYQTYDVREYLGEDNELIVTVAGGWAVGSFVFTRKNRISAKRQSLLLEIHIKYEDGTFETVATDESWEVTEDGPYRMADFYDGEIYDARHKPGPSSWKGATYEKLCKLPEIVAEYGIPVKAHERFSPVATTSFKNETIYDFGQNMAGLVSLKIKGKKGQKIRVRHAEILNPDGSLNTDFLRTAKATIQYTCIDGDQEYMPRLTYMGFRYVSVSGIEAQNIEIEAVAVYSDLETTGYFDCSNEMLNRLNQNILWSSKSNFVDIPTDCPQRDERMGWTGDIAVFAPTACYNFDMSRFLDKWLRDVQAEQRPTGGIPNVVPEQGFGFPATMPVMAVDFWGDACILVPWAEYIARGDLSILKKYYAMMKKYVDACRFWAGLFSFGQKRFIWDTHHMLHFGDWVAPDVPHMSQWQKRSKWTATASLKNTSGLLSRIAGLLGYEEDEKHYKELSEEVARAYVDILSDGHGKMYEEFQTAYVLPIYYQMFSEDSKHHALEHLVRLVKERDYCIGTGFPGTPYILFALADNGYADIAYKMLLNTKSPSWLYEVKMGATTIWERWDGLNDKGECPIGDDGTDSMISYNHYASGAIGHFLYSRILGIEAIEAGYKTFSIKPLLGGELHYAKGSVLTPYGWIQCDWKIKENTFSLDLNIPVGTTCQLTLPTKTTQSVASGKYHFETYLESTDLEQ